MKKILLLVTIFTLSVLNANCQKKEFKLANIEAQIENASQADSKNNNNDSLKFIYKGLTALEKKKKNRIYTYWQAYTLLNISQNEFANGKKDQAKKNINNAISKLESIKRKNADEYSLLALLQCISMSLEPAGAMWRLKDISENIDAALKIEPQNIRANYVDATFDYYTPEVYGGGGKVVKRLEFAINNPEQKHKNTYLPSWGKKESYELIIQYYIKKNNKTEATKYCKMAIKNYPNYYAFNKLWNKVNKMM